MTEITPAGPAVVGIERWIQETRIRERAVSDEPALHLGAAFLAQIFEALLGPCADSPHAGELCGSVGSNKTRIIVRLVWIAGIIQIELRSVLVGIVLGTNGRIENVEQ